MEDIEDSDFAEGEDYGPVCLVYATAEQYEEFKTSVIWKDLVRELNSWKKGFELERSAIVEDAAEKNPSTATVLMHLGSIDGRIKAVNYILSLPDILSSIAKDQQEEKK